MTLLDCRIDLCFSLVQRRRKQIRLRTIMVKSIAADLTVMAVLSTIVNPHPVIPDECCSAVSMDATVLALRRILPDPRDWHGRQWWRPEAKRICASTLIGCCSRGKILAPQQMHGRSRYQCTPTVMDNAKYARRTLAASGRNVVLDVAMTPTWKSSLSPNVRYKTG